MDPRTTTRSHRPEIDLVEAVAALKRRYRPAKPLADPLEIILYDNIGYLISEDRRAALFEEFGARVGFSAKAIAAAPHATLLDMAARGGMKPETRVDRWRDIARLVLEAADGDLAAALASRPVAKARTLLKRFPSIADPGADKILLFTGADIRPALDSNGLRVMIRLGAAEAGPSYAASYRNAIRALATKGKMTRAWLTDAYLALQAHGRALCKRAGPDCLPCPLDAACAHVAYIEG
jgi:endonuclease-3